MDSNELKARLIARIGAEYNPIPPLHHAVMDDVVEKYLAGDITYNGPPAEVEDILLTAMKGELDTLRERILENFARESVNTFVILPFRGKIFHISVNDVKVLFPIS